MRTIIIILTGGLIYLTAAFDDIQSFVIAWVEQHRWGLWGAVIVCAILPFAAIDHAKDQIRKRTEKFGLVGLDLEKAHNEEMGAAYTLIAIFAVVGVLCLMAAVKF